MHAGLPEPAARRRSIASPVVFDPLERCRCVEVDDPYLEYAPKQFCIKMVFAKSPSGQTTRSCAWRRMQSGCASRLGAGNGHEPSGIQGVRSGFAEALI